MNFRHLDEEIVEMIENYLHHEFTNSVTNSAISIPENGKFLQVNGIEIYYEEYGNPSNKKTILFIHGFLSSSFSFRCLIPNLSKQYKIINIDLPPFGRSGKDRKFCYSYENLAKTLNQFVDRLRLNQVILAGHSMGGQICLNMIHQKPNRYEKSILLASSGYLQRAKHSLIALSYLPFFHIFIKNKLAKTGVEKNLESVVYDHSKITKEMIQGYLQPFIEDEQIFIGLKKLLRDREGDLSPEVLQKIQTPALLIWGEHDKIVPLSVGKRLKDDIPNSKLVILKNTGHLIPEENPEETCKLMTQFIENSPSLSTITV